MRRVSIGIPSFNEEKNIVNLLKAIESQPAFDFIIHEVIISDDSTDRTPDMIREFAKVCKLKIRLLHHEKRRGAAAAWNEIFKTASGEVIVLYDADTVPHDLCTKELVSGLDEKIALVASNPVPVQTEGVAGRASVFISNWLRSLRKARLSQYTVMGRALAIDSNAAAKIAIPEEVIAIDLYLQCKILEAGVGMVYNDNAVVYFKPANSTRDFSSQVTRAVNGHRQIEEYVSRSGIALPSAMVLTQTVKSMIMDPLGALATGICFMMTPYHASKLASANSAKWHTAETSKSIDFDRLKAKLS